MSLAENSLSQRKCPNAAGNRQRGRLRTVRVCEEGRRQSGWPHLSLLCSPHAALPGAGFPSPPWLSEDPPAWWAHAAGFLEDPGMLSSSVRRPELTLVWVPAGGEPRTDALLQPWPHTCWRSLRISWARKPALPSGVLSVLEGTTFLRFPGTVGLYSSALGHQLPRSPAASIQ